MSYLPFVIAAYAVFVLVLAWDFITPRLQLRRQLRATRALAHRQQAMRKPHDANTELVR